MATTFVYKVYGSDYEFRGSDVWGQAWQDAKAKAAELHTGITRIVEEDGKEPRYEFYAKGKVFLDLMFFHPSRLRIFGDEG